MSNLPDGYNEDGNFTGFQDDYSLIDEQDYERD